LKRLLTPENILDELESNPEKYPTKDCWTTYILNLAYTVWDDALLLKIEKGGDLSDSDKQYEEFFNILTGLGEHVWQMAREHENGGDNVQY